MQPKPELIDEKLKEGIIECEETDSKETDNLRLRKKAPSVLNRSDSTGSASGRKFLAPTLSDPQTTRNEKDRYSSKKKSPRPQGTVKNNLPHLNEINHNNHHLHHHHHHHHVETQSNNKLNVQSNNQVNLIYEVHDWWQEQMVCAQSSDEE